MCITVAVPLAIDFELRRAREVRRLSPRALHSQCRNSLGVPVVAMTSMLGRPTPTGKLETNIPAGGPGRTDRSSHTGHRRSPDTAPAAIGAPATTVRPTSLLKEEDARALHSCLCSPSREDRQTRDRAAGGRPRPFPLLTLRHSAMRTVPVTKPVSGNMAGTFASVLLMLSATTGELPPWNCRSDSALSDAA